MRVYVLFAVAVALGFDVGVILILGGQSVEPVLPQASAISKGTDKAAVFLSYDD
jgi:hypothetical protein